MAPVSPKEQNLIDKAPQILGVDVDVDVAELETWFEQFIAAGESILHSVLQAKLDLAESIGGSRLRNQLQAKYCEEEQKERPYNPMN